ncbi:hypothetical protein [Actinoallomurus sp. NPDC052274]|uniref:hypothetical protein n=1 Tax=Actinoallomurus sp. NPDC052274 TaxID=3155420 RepID=UPI00343AE6AB
MEEFIGRWPEPNRKRGTVPHALIRIYRKDLSASLRIIIGHIDEKLIRGVQSGSDRACGRDALQVMAGCADVASSSGKPRQRPNAGLISVVDYRPHPLATSLPAGAYSEDFVRYRTGLLRQQGVKHPEGSACKTSDRRFG